MDRKAMAGVAVAAVAVAGGYVAATAYTGQKIQEAYEARIVKLEQELPFIQIVDRKTDRGLFSATYSAGVRFGCNQPFVIGFTDHVRHGPLPGLRSFGAAVIDSTIALPPTAPQALRQYLDNLEPGYIRTQVGYAGGYRAAIRLPAGEVAGPSGKFGWAEILLTGAGKLDGSVSSFEASLPLVSFKAAGDKGASAKLVDLRMHGENHGDGGSLWLRQGRSALEIASIDIQADAGGTAVAAQLVNMRYGTEVTGDKELLNGKVSLTADAKLTVGADSKPIQLDNMELQESFQRLHAPTLKKLATSSMSSLPGCDAAGESAEEDAASKNARVQDMLQLLAQLLPYNPEFAVDKLAMGYDGRRGELSYSVGVRDFALKKGESLAAAQPRLMQAVVLRANTKLPAAWIEQLGALGDEAGAQRRAMQAQTMLDVAIGKGFLVRNGDEITGELLFERGAATLNGKPLGAH